MPTPFSFHSARLQRVLADLDCQPAMLEPGALARQLSQWVGFGQAIELAALHGSQDGAQPAGPRTLADVVALRVLKGMEALFSQTRSQLERSIVASPLPPADLAPDNTLPSSADGLTRAFEPYQRYYLAQQRTLEAAAGPLRTKLREALATCSPAMRQLAQLDSAMEKLMVEQESRLLYSLTRLLKQRFAQHYHAPLASAETAERSSTNLTDFGQELQTVLLAELELRLQPALGLLQALQQEFPSKP